MIRQMVLLPLERYERLVQREERHQRTNVPLPILSEDVILSFMPIKVKEKAQSLLKLLSDVISWNESGEISCGHTNEFIPNSNIADLVRICLNNYKNFDKFIGIDSFCQVLADKNVPLTLLNNYDLRNKIESLKGVIKKDTWLSL